jgi:hypothetical protein
MYSIIMVSVLDLMIAGFREKISGRAHIALHARVLQEQIPCGFCK